MRFNWFKMKIKSSAVTLDNQLAILKNIGIKLKPSFNNECLFDHYNKEEIEEDPYIRLMVSLGSEMELDHYCVYISDDIWHLDTECIEDHGDYQRIVERLVELSNGSLKITDINDYIDIDNEKAWVTFKVDDEIVKHDLRVEDDWLDISIISILTSIVNRQKPGKKFYYAVLGQDILIVCFTEEQIHKLNKLLSKKIIFE